MSEWVSGDTQSQYTHETHTSFLLHSLSVCITVFKDAVMLCSRRCCWGNQGKHAAVKSHFSSFPSSSGQSRLFFWLLFKVISILKGHM